MSRVSGKGGAMKQQRVLVLVITAVLIAMVAVFTILVRIPIPATQGYVSFCDVGTYFAGMAFGPWVGLVAGGVGAAIADVQGGFAQFALLSLLAHGLQGLLAGLLGRGRKLPGLILAWAAGALAMMGIYLLGEGLVLTGWGAALAEVPFNLVQTVVGGVIGIPLYLSVRRAYPPLEQLGRPVSWREEQ